MSDYARYSRQVILREVGVNGQSLLRDSTVLIIGVGGLGAPASLYLAGAGIGRLILSDRDHVERSNLQRQIVYRNTDLGRPKLDAAADNLRALNPECSIETRPGPLDDAGLLAAIREADVVLDCSDNFPTRFAVNRACVAARKPLVSGAAIRFEGQIALFLPGGPCYACLFGEGGEAAETCEEAGVLGPVVGVIGAMQALLALKVLLGIGDDSARLHLWDAGKLSWRGLAIARDADCRVCGNPT
ncbi:HesA/MoeB/ThiF family protein [Nevskia sp.]|uniref:HesA/MoeB/ThiF family protein n=1 Tax=Nevskia sp. TaxID=1929292 RepID=UPI0025E6A17F|nr:HesA/MoeB/ThiF family protein [Nevskia sp.]